PTILFYLSTPTTYIYTLSLHDALPIWIKFERINRKTGRALFYFDGEDPRHAAHYSRIVDPAVREPHNRYTQSFSDDEVLDVWIRSEEHTSELQSRFDLVCRLLLEKKKK